MKHDRAAALANLFLSDTSGLLPTGEETIIRRQSPEEILSSDLARYMRMSHAMGEAHRPPAVVTELGKRLGQAQGWLTSFQARVLVALYVGSWSHPDSVEPMLGWSLLATHAAEHLHEASSGPGLRNWPLAVHVRY